MRWISLEQSECIIPRIPLRIPGCLAYRMRRCEWKLAASEVEAFRSKGGLEKNEMGMEGFAEEILPVNVDVQEDTGRFQHHNT